MGQQQLLLLVMGIVLVALAVVIGTVVFENKMRQNTVDNLLGRGLTIASEAVYWKTKTDPYRGGNASYSGLENNGMQALFVGETTLVGTYKITKAIGNELVITAVSTKYPEVGIQIFVNGNSIDSTTVVHDGSITLGS